MSGRRPRGAGIRGPHSALTDFLAANNISAQEIRDSYLQRVQQADADADASASASAHARDTPDNGEGPSNPNGDNGEEEPAESSAMAAERTRKRKRNQEEVLAKIKNRKAVTKSSKKKQKGSDHDSDFDDGFVDMYKKAKPLPGQLANCALCDKRFTVTPYSKAGPDGGLLCTPCGKEMVKEAKAAETAKKPVVRKGRRKMESNRLDGLAFRGSKTLQQLCIEKLAKHSEDIEEFGEMPEQIMERLSEIFSKKRAMTSNTLRLFLQPDRETVSIPDAAYLETEDFSQIFAVVPHIKKLSLRNCCQFKDENMDYMIEKAKDLTDIQLLGANLVSNDKWIDLFIARGSALRSLKVEWLDAAFNDQAVEALVEFCPNIERLKLERCKRIGAESIDAIARLQHLKHLSLCFTNEVPREKILNAILSIGANLRTLCLERFVNSEAKEDSEDGDYNEENLTDQILIAIHDTCKSLDKLRFSENNECSDAGYVNLFTKWSNSPLRYIDLNSTRDVDNTKPEGPEDFPIGLASEGFKALMKHSGSKLEYLDISSCRHISHATFTSIFEPSRFYPHLREINLSFCPVVDTGVVAGIFRSCPKIKKVVTFGCFEVQDVEVPRDVVLIGAPRAQDAIEQFGQVYMDFQKDMQRHLVDRTVPAVG